MGDANDRLDVLTRLVEEQGQQIIKLQHLIRGVLGELRDLRAVVLAGTDTEPHDHGIIRALNSKYSPNERVVGDPKCTIFICRLHAKTDEATLYKKFEKFGKIIRCRLVRDIVTGKSKCYGFIEYSDRISTKQAIHKMHKEYIDDCEIIVEYEFERTMKGWRPRRLGGGFGGKKESGQLRFGGITRPFQRPINIKPQTDFKSRISKDKKK